MMECNQNHVCFLRCAFSYYFPVLRPERVAVAGADDLLTAREDDALPPAETFPINKFKQLTPLT